MLRSSLGALVFVAACGNLRVDPASPRPNVDLAAAISPASLTLDASIRDSFVIPRTPSVNEVPVSGWRGTLTRGFDAGFKGGASGRVLVLREAELSFGPAAIGMGGTAAVRAHIRFKSSLVDPSGAELGRRRRARCGDLTEPRSDDDERGAGDRGDVREDRRSHRASRPLTLQRAV
jgi:hypothetical protein